MIPEMVKYLRHSFTHPKKHAGWYPFLAVFYLTYRCEFRCMYCSDGNANPYYSLSPKHMPPEAVIKTLTAIRKHCNYLVITGGEPLEYPHWERLWPEIARLKFKEVVLTTNARYLMEHLPGIAQAVTQLVCSVDTLVPSRADHIYGVGTGVFEQVLENIETAHQLPKRCFDIMLSTVLTPKYLEDAYDVYALCKKRGWYFAACPQLVGVKAHHLFQHNAAYQRFIQFLIDEKSNNRRIFGTRLYLEYMRDLKKFECRPFSMLVVSPLGKVYYPCLELGHDGGQLTEYSDLQTLRKRAEKKYGHPPVCDTCCHSACALSFSTVLNHPFETLIKELLSFRTNRG
jgi:MoaA/NifB/PqqE/SkfB family radical SAM enzyme